MGDVVVVGIDLSLTETGVSCGAHGDPEQATFRLPFRDARGPHRLEMILSNLAPHLERRHADVAVLEGWGHLQAAALAVIEAHGVVKLHAYQQHTPLVLVPPTSMKLFATGKGNATKAQTVLAADRRHGYPGDNENEAEAWLLRAMGEAHYNREPGELTQYELRALSAISWPEAV